MLNPTHSHSVIRIHRRCTKITRERATNARRAHSVTLSGGVSSGVFDELREEQGT